MSLSENIAQMFVNNYEDMKCKRIVLYGLGGNTRRILEEFQGFHIVALMDPEKIGAEYWGLPVISVEEAKEIADVVVIIARDSVLKIIYSRICSLEECGIPIYDIRRNRLKDVFSNSNHYEENPYWTKSLYELKSEIDKYDIVSFDIYDTLIMRRVLRYNDIFELVEETVRKNYKIEMDYSYYRMLAEDEENQRNTGVADIYQIYDRLQELTGIDDSRKKVLLETEIEIEMSYSCIRKDIFNCLNYALDSGKKVYLISDMYFTSEQLGRILRHHGITRYDKLLISCEENKTKASGELFFTIEAAERNKMLHIGDNYDSDVINAERAGCSTYEIWSSYQMILNSNLSNLLIHIKSIGDSLLAGQFLSTILNSPFAMSSERGRITLDKWEDFCKVSFVPYFIRLAQWLIQLPNWKEKKKSVFLLSARDGFLIKRILDSLVINEDIKKNIPRYAYFYTSRRASTVAAIYNLEDIMFVLKNISITAEFAYILESRFGIIPDENDTHLNESISTMVEMDKLCSYLRPYYKKILEKAEWERNNYLKYISKNFNICGTDDIFLYDLACQGTVAYNMQKLFKQNVKLICLATFNIPNAYFRTVDDTISLLGNFDDYHLTLKALQYYKLIEIISSSGETSLINFDQEGNPEFDKTVRYENAAQIAHMQDIIVDTISNWSTIDPIWQERNYSIELCDFMFSLIEEKYSVVSEDIKDVFIYESKEDNDKEHNIWQEIIQGI